MDHHDDWAHWPADDPGPHDGDHDALAGHDGLGGHDGDPGGHDPFGPDHAADAGHHDDGLAGLSGHDGPDDPYQPPDLRHDADLGDLPDPRGHPGDPEPSMVDGPEPAEAGAEIHLFGVDHDLPPGDPDPGAVADFPPPLDLPDRPEPVDGYPWSDADTLGDAGTGWPDLVDAGPSAHELLSYAGMDPPVDGGDGWAALVDSDDPAVSALARWWGPLG